MGRSEFGKRVLVVEDESMVAEMFGKFLTRSGYTVKIAPNALEAIRACLRQMPDVILTDYLMPEMNGIELLREIRKMRSDIPVILMSGQADMRTAVTALKEQAFDFLSKPVDSAELLATLEQALAQKAQDEPVNVERTTDKMRVIGAVVCVRPDNKPDVSLLHFNRPLDQFSSRNFDEPLRRLAVENELRSGIVVILGNVSYINNVGLGFLLEIVEKWKAAGHKVILTEMPNQLAKYLKTLGYLDYLPNTVTVADALDQVS